MIDTSTKKAAITSSPISRRSALKLGVAATVPFCVENVLARPASVLGVHRSTRGLTIEGIERTTVKVPYRPAPQRNMARELPHWKWTEILEVKLQSGDVGFGETLLYYTWGVTGDNDVKRALGKNAADLLWDDSLGPGLQIALFDAVAKWAGVPVHRLLGKQLRKKTPLAWWNIDTTVEDMAAECQEAYKQGYTSYKSKGRPWFDVWKQIEVTSKAVPDNFKLAIDFNDTLRDAERGIPILKELEKYPQIAIWETPIPQGDIPGNQAIRKNCRGKVAMHYGTPAPAVAIKTDVCDGFVVSGSAASVMKAGHVAAIADKPFWLQLVGTGVTAAFSLHFGAVLTHATWPAVNCHQLYTHTLLAQPITVKDGYTEIPDKPGLGFDLDRDAMAKFKVSKPKRRPDPPRLMLTTWPDGKKMYVANTGGVNFMLNAANRNRMPYFEKGVDTRLVPNDGSAEWKENYNKARKGPYLIKP